MQLNATTRAATGRQWPAVTPEEESRDASAGASWRRSHVTPRACGLCCSYLWCRLGCVVRIVVILFFSPFLSSLWRLNPDHIFIIEILSLQIKSMILFFIIWSSVLIRWRGTTIISLWNGLHSLTTMTSGWTVCDRTQRLILRNWQNIWRYLDLYNCKDIVELT